VSGAVEGRRLARYRPEIGSRKPWKWRKSKTSNAAVHDSGTVETVVPEQADPKRGDGSLDARLRILKRGDRIVISLRGIPSREDIEDVIDDEGNITLPLIGTVTIERRTTSEAERMIEKAYTEGKYYSKINVIVVAPDYEYFVRGEVQRPGRYPLAGDLTLLQIIAAAGGYTDFAKRAKIEIRRGGSVLECNANRIDKGRERDPLIKPGDIIMVPRRWLF